MHESWITLLTFVATTLLTISLGTLVYDWLFSYRVAVRQRMMDVSGTASGDKAVSLFKDMKRLHGGQIAYRPSWRDQLQTQIDLAGLNYSARTFAWGCAACAGVSALTGLLGSWWLAVLFGATGAVFPLAVLSFRQHSRQRKLSRQLPEAFAMISRAVKAGQTIPAALQIIAEDFEAPISTEFARCYEHQNLGVSRESALRQLAKRTGIMELQIFVVAMLVQAKSGGDIVELLDNLSSRVRKRLKLKDRVRALTGEGRMQALVLVVLPIASLIGIIILAPDYASSLLDRPWLLAVAGAGQAVGAFWIRRIVNFEF